MTTKAAAVGSSRRCYRWCPRRCRRPRSTSPRRCPPVDEPEEELAPQPVVVVHAHPLNADKATWSVSLFSDAFVKLRKVAVHLGVLGPNDPLQRTVKDYTFKINILTADLERGVLTPIDDDDDVDGSLDGSGTGSDDGAPLAATTSA
jgi:hypothetical protein